MLRSLITFFAAAQIAAGVLINFDSLPSTSGVPGPPANPDAILTTQLSNLGVIFGRPGLSAGVSVVNNATSVSSPNIIVGLDNNAEQPGWLTGDIFFSFVAPGSLTPSFTDSVSFSLGDGGGDVDNFIIRAFNLAGDQINIQFFSGTEFMIYTLALPGIHRIEVDFIPPDNTGLGGYGIDNLSFNDPANVPEPATIFLFLPAAAIAIIALIVRRRRRAS